MASKAGPVGGAATLSSFRVQKAFSINFRENKRLLTEIKLIENDHIRSIRQVKQDIKVTRIWLDHIRESTGYSQHGLRPDSGTENQGNSARKRGKKTPQQRSKTTDPTKINNDVIIRHESSEDEDDDVTKHSEKDQIAHVHFSSTDQPNEKAMRPSTIATTGAKLATSGARSQIKSQPAEVPINVIQEREATEKQDADVEDNDTGNRKQRGHSATSRGSQASLTTYQRRRRLHDMMVRKRNPLEIKKEMNCKEGERVETKVRGYLSGLAERMKIDLPPLIAWGDDIEA